MSEAHSPKKFHGKFRGTVVTNTDPEQRGRITCMVPDVLGTTPSSYCEASPALAGPTGPSMGVYMVPPIGAGVWVEFEQGDPNRPIWASCRVGTGDAPSSALLGNPLSPNICFQSLLQNMLMISDSPPTPATGGIILQSATGAKIVVNDSGIYISNGKGASINLVGPQIDINNGALTIT